MPAPLTKMRGGTEIIRLAIPEHNVNAAREIAKATGQKLPAVLRDMVVIGIATYRVVMSEEDGGAQ